MNRKLALLRPCVAVLIACMSCLCLAAKDDQPRAIESPAQAKPGVVGLVTAENGMRYFLRLPKRHNASAGARLIVFLHGSNMNGLSYLRSFEAKKWCEEDILCCPNGENGSDPFGGNNFGFNSGPLVAQIIKSLQGEFKTTATYIGGHSQGAFLTYNVILNHPDLCSGAFPMAGDCWMQNEPNLWETKPEVLAKQRQIAIAVIHGQADPVVKYAQGRHAHDCFRAMGWTKLRLFDPKSLNHMFMLAPIDEALEWLDAVNGRPGKKTAALVAKWSKEGEWGWARHASKAATTPASVLSAAEAAAAKAVPTMKAAMDGEPAAWIPAWAEFWRVHGEAEAAKPLVSDYLSRRASERDAAVRHSNEAQQLFRAGKRDEGRAVLATLCRECPHSYQALSASQWLAEPR